MKRMLNALKPQFSARRIQLLVVLALAIVLILSAATVLVINATYDQPEIASPGNPASGFDRVYMDSTTHKWTCLTSSGGSCAPSGGGGGGFIQTLTAPVHSAFSQINFAPGSGVVTTEFDNSTPVTSVSVTLQDPSATGNIVALAQPVVSSKNFTVTAAFSIAGDVSAAPLAGMYFDDGGSPPKICLYNYATASQLNILKFSNFTTFFSAPYSVNNAGAWPAGPLLWMRVSETASTRTFLVSSDGINFSSIYSESSSSFFVTANYGFGLKMNGGGVITNNSMITLYSFQATSP